MIFPIFAIFCIIGIYIVFVGLKSRLLMVLSSNPFELDEVIEQLESVFMSVNSNIANNNNMFNKMKETVEKSSNHLRSEILPLCKEPTLSFTDYYSLLHTQLKEVNSVTKTINKFMQEFDMVVNELGSTFRKEMPLQLETRMRNCITSIQSQIAHSFSIMHDIKQDFIDVNSSSMNALLGILSESLPSVVEELSNHLSKYDNDMTSKLVALIQSGERSTHNDFISFKDFVDSLSTSDSIRSSLNSVVSSLAAKCSSALSSLTMLSALLTPSSNWSDTFSSTTPIQYVVDVIKEKAPQVIDPLVAYLSSFMSIPNEAESLLLLRSLLLNSPSTGDWSLTPDSSLHNFWRCLKSELSSTSYNLLMLYLSSLASSCPLLQSFVSVSNDANNNGTNSTSETASSNNSTHDIVESQRDLRQSLGLMRSPGESVSDFTRKTLSLSDQDIQMRNEAIEHSLDETRIGESNRSIVSTVVYNHINTSSGNIRESRYYTDSDLNGVSIASIIKRCCM